MRNVFGNVAMLALLGTTTVAPSKVPSANGTVARGRVTSGGPTRLEAMSAAEFRRFVRDGNQWEERTKTWQNHETTMTSASPSRITRLWGIAEVSSIRLQSGDLRDRRPRVVLMFGNDGPYAMHGMAPGDTMYAVLQMEEKSDAIEAFGVVVTLSGRVLVHSLGRPQVCYRWRPAATELSYPSFISGRSCDVSVDDSHNTGSLENTRTIDLGSAGPSESDDADTAPTLVGAAEPLIANPAAPRIGVLAGLRNKDWNCTGGFTCSDGTCAIAFPDDHTRTYELK